MTATDSGSGFLGALRAAESRITAAEAARHAAADARARVIADEVARRGRGGAASVAREMGVTPAKISGAVSRARGLPVWGGSLPVDTVARGLAAELTPRPLLHWEYLAHLVRGIFFDAVWAEAQPGPLLASEIAESDELPADVQDELVAEAASWPRFTALAVLEVCLRNALDELPTTDDGTDEGEHR